MHKDTKKMEYIDISLKKITFFNPSFVFPRAGSSESPSKATKKNASDGDVSFGVWKQKPALSYSIASMSFSKSLGSVVGA